MKLIIQFVEFCFSLLEAGLKFTFEFTEFIVSNIPRKKEGYHSSFAPASSLLSSGYKGFCLTGDKNLSLKSSYQNCLVVGGSGTGKSSIVLLPSTFTMSGSFVIHDPSGELFAKSAGYLRDKGYEIKTLNFANPDVSSGYNPLQRANSSSDIQKVSAMLIENTVGKGSKDPFWTKMGEGLLSMMVSVLKKQEPQYQNLYNLRQLLNQLGGNPEKVDSLFAYYADPTLYSEYKSFLAYDSKVISGVTATCKAALQIFSDDAVARVTSFDTLDLQKFRNGKIALFINNYVASQRYYACLTSIFFEQFFSYIMSRFPNENEQDIFFLIDEASSLKFPTLPLAVANVRKHRSGIMLVVQDFNQMIHNYGKQEAESVRSNCFAKLYFTGQGIETATELERTLGKYEYTEKDKTKKVRPLMTADEIRIMRASRALLICGHHAPIQVKLKPYYESSRFRNNDRIHPPARPSEIPFKDLPVLDLSSIESTV